MSAPPAPSFLVMLIHTEHSLVIVAVELIYASGVTFTTVQSSSTDPDASIEPVTENSTQSDTN